MMYILTPYQAALDARLVTKLTTRLRNNDNTIVLLHQNDFDNYTPMIEIPTEVENEEGVKTFVAIERYANDLEEKVATLLPDGVNPGSVILTNDQAQVELTKPEWRGKEAKDGTK